MESQTHIDGTSQEQDRKGVKKVQNTFENTFFCVSQNFARIKLEGKKKSDRVAAGILNSTFLQSSSYKSKLFRKDNEDLNDLTQINFKNMIFFIESEDNSVLV